MLDDTHCFQPRPKKGLCGSCYQNFLPYTCYTLIFLSANFFFKIPTPDHPICPLEAFVMCV